MLGRDWLPRLPTPFLLMLLSVVIPVYNALPYLRKCVGSVCAAPIEDMEVICVDDGSTDGSAALLDELAAANPRVRVVRRANGGVSAARNTGLAEARGEYVAFVDDDDVLEPDYLPQLLETAGKHPQADCLIGGFRVSGGAAVENCPVCREPMVADAAVRDLRLTLRVWGRLYRAELIRTHGISFAEDVHFGEDTLFNYMLFPLCRQIVLCPTTGYTYQTRGDSLSASVYEYVAEMADATLHLAEFMHAHPQANGGAACVAGYAVHALRRIHSMAPHAAQRACAAKVRAALQLAGYGSDSPFPGIPSRNACMLRKILGGGTALGAGYYWKRLSRMFKRFLPLHQS